MTVISRHDKAPSTLGDIIENVKAMFANAGSSVPIQVGRFYEQANQGTPPKIVFIPEVNGRIEDALFQGHAASWTHGCDVLVRAKPGLNDEKRFIYAYQLADQVIAALSIAGSGRLKWGSVNDDSPSTTDKLGGVGLRISFTFRRDVAHWEKLWSLPEPVEPQDKPIKTPAELSQYTPPGFELPEPLERGTTVTATATTVPKE